MVTTVKITRIAVLRLQNSEIGTADVPRVPGGQGNRYENLLRENFSNVNFQCELL